MITDANLIFYLIDEHNSLSNLKLSLIQPDYLIGYRIRQSGLFLRVSLVTQVVFVFDQVKIRFILLYKS